MEAGEQEEFVVAECDIPPLEIWRVLLITSALGGVFLGWGVQIGSGSSVLLDLGCSSGVYSLSDAISRDDVCLQVTSTVWLFGPISGIITAPIVGRLSDGCNHSLGRR